MTEITSTQNERVKLVRALQTQAKARRSEGKFVVEGTRLLADALERGLLPDFVLYTAGDMTLDNPISKVFRRLLNLKATILSVSESVMNEISDVETPPGVLGVFSNPNLPLPEKAGLVLVLDEMRNPGNMGSVLRTAAASGVDVALLTPNTVDPFNPKVVRGGMGAHFRLPLAQLEWTEIMARYGRLDIYLADVGGETFYYDVNWRQPSVIIMGSEAHGPGAMARQVAQAITIPMAGGMESLNAAVAAGVILFEVQRQRSLAAREGARSR
jgi:TrmH family RNA methyltransferase